jgi:predicted glycoside hydrolase/deacetylase ChbG (UPF0249 family)
MRQLVVNADDFGASSGTNQGILRAHAAGIVTSTSLMVRHTAATEAPDAARAHPRLGFGLHVDLGEWVYQDERWSELYRVVDLNDAAAVTAEVERQYRIFRQIMGREPTHIDSHQHVHRDGHARQAVVNLGNRLNVPVRHCTPGLQYCGDFYGQSGKGYPCPDSISPEALMNALRRLGDGTWELACHPGLDVELPSTYRTERLEEVRSLCDLRVRQCIGELKLQLRNFGTLKGS